MRASQSRTTVLDGAFAPADRIVRRLDPGPERRPAHLRHLRELRAPARRRLHRHRRARARARRRGRAPAHLDEERRRALAQDPDIRWRIADAALAQDALPPQLVAIAATSTLVDHGAQWFAKLVGVKACDRDRQAIVDQAVRVSGGSTYFAGSELGRLYRDVLAGLFHPSDDESAHGTVANAWLGPIED